MNGRPLVIKFLTAAFAIAGLINLLALIAPACFASMAGFSWLINTTDILATAILAIIGIFQLITAWTIYEKEEYASDLAILFAILGLFSYPAGTILMALSIIMMATSDARQWLS